MHLTRFTDYSLRVLIYLGLKGEQRSTIQEIAEQFDISRNHLMKVVHELGQKGYVTAIRGKHGGLVLQRPPEEINLGMLVRDTEHDLRLVECFGEHSDCRINQVCLLRSVFDEALQAFLAILDRYTLADILDSRYQQLAQVLRIAPLS